jgi:hypothetical protein
MDHTSSIADSDHYSDRWIIPARNEGRGFVASIRHVVYNTASVNLKCDANQSTRLDMYRICWSIPSTDSSGHGNYMESEELASAWLAYLTNEYPEIVHWIETQ